LAECALLSAVVTVKFNTCRARVVDEDVELAKVLADGESGVLDGLVIGDVELNRVDVGESAKSGGGGFAFGDGAGSE
jgi:hypothetical protein